MLSIAPLIARAISEVFSDGSVTSLFDGPELSTVPERVYGLAARLAAVLDAGCPGEGRGADDVG